MRNRTSASSSGLLRRVGANLEQHCGVERGTRLLVAVSGGADSMALFHVLRELAPRLRLELLLAHFDHALRDNSAADAVWVAGQAHVHGVPLHTQRWTAPRPGEAAARAARYTFLRDTARAHSCSAIVLAHHRDDQMETILLRLGRGVGLRGALGMAWRRAGEPPVVRPLLDVTRDELRAFLNARGATWRDDPTNLDRGPVRNRLRHDVFPGLDAALGPRWHQHWNTTWTDLREIWTWVDGLAAQLLQHAGGDRLRVDVLRSADDPILRAALQRWMDGAPEGASRAQLDELVHLVRHGRSGSRVELAGGFVLSLEQGFLARYSTPAGPAPAALMFECREVDAAAARAALERRAGGRSQGSRDDDEAYLAAEALALPLGLRVARAGDRIQLLGGPGRRAVARLLQDRRVPRRERDGWPVVEDSEGPIWLPGIGVAERGRVGPNTLSALWLRVSPQPPPAAAAAIPQGLPEGTVQT